MGYRDIEINNFAKIGTMNFENCDQQVMSFE